MVDMRLLFVLLTCGPLLTANPLELAIRRARLSRTSATQTLATQHRREVVLFGAIPLECGLDAFETRVRGIQTFKKGPEVLAVGLFQPHAALNDLRTLKFADAELDSLRRCRPGECDWRLPKTAIERLHRDARWDQPGARQRANDIVRDEILASIRAYQEGGATRLPAYHDKATALSTGVESREMIEASRGLLAEVPELQRHLLTYPAAPLSGAEDFFYWSLEKMGPRPVFSATHMTIYRTGPRLYIVSRQIYGNHYLDGALGISRLEQDPVHADRAWLEYVNRSRLGLLDGAFSSVRRMILEEALRRTLHRYLNDLALRVRRPTLTAASLSNR